MSNFATKTVRTTVSDETGEVLESKTVDKLVHFKKSEGLKFVNIMEGGLYLFDNLTANEIKVYIYLSMNMGFDGNNFVDVSQFLRKKISERLNISRNTVRNILASLKKKNVLRIDDSGQHQINPLVLYRGKTINSVRALDEYNSKCSVNN